MLLTVSAVAAAVTVSAVTVSAVGQRGVRCAAGQKGDALVKWARSWSKGARHWLNGRGAGQIRARPDDNMITVHCIVIILISILYHYYTNQGGCFDRHLTSWTVLRPPRDSLGRCSDPPLDQLGGASAAI